VEKIYNVVVCPLQDQESAAVILPDAHVLSCERGGLPSVPDFQTSLGQPSCRAGRANLEMPLQAHRSASSTGSGGGGSAAPSHHHAGLSGHDRRGVTFKVLMLGDSAVGKTCLVGRAVEGERGFHDQHAATVGIDMQSKTFPMGDGGRARLQIWDTAGQERFRSIAAQYFRGANAVVMVYDVTRHGSFANIKSWLSSVAASAAAECALVLAGNKADVPEEERAVLREEGEALAAELGVSFYETSALTGEGVEPLFSDLARRLYAPFASPSPASTTASPGGAPGRRPADDGGHAPGRPAASAVAGAGGGGGGGGSGWKTAVGGVDLDAVEAKGIRLHAEHEARKAAGESRCCG
jgi:small GTP-binding protein